MSLTGREISDFTVQTYAGGAFGEVKKSNVLGKWAAFFFYPVDFILVCPTELKDLADKHEDFKSAGCEIYGVSCDNHFAHKVRHDASRTIQKIKHSMLADPTSSLARDSDVMVEADGMTERGSFIANSEGKIVACEVTVGNVGRNADELLRRAQTS